MVFLVRILIQALLIVGVYGGSDGICKTYKVQPGDGSWKIGNENNCSQALVETWNGKKWGENWPLIDEIICISPGHLPTKDDPVDPIIPAQNTTEPVIPIIGEPDEEVVFPCAKFYSVKSGDTCESIARTADVNVDEFYFVNKKQKSTCTTDHTLYLLFFRHPYSFWE